MKKILLMTASLGVLAACGTGGDVVEEVEIDEEALENVNDSGMPIVNEPIELNFFSEVAPQHDDWNDLFIWNEYEEMTNISVNFEQVSPEAIEEQRNLALVREDLPDVFFHAFFPTADVQRYGQQGVFLPLNDLIEEHAPNLSRIFEEYPEIEGAATMADGNIYSMPMIIHPDFLSYRMRTVPFINGVWLDELGMDLPETTEEFYDYLVAVKEEDFAGDGRTVPYGSPNIGETFDYFAGAFGVMNQGFIEGPGVDLDENGDVRFFAVEDDYRKVLEYMNRLYEEELMDPNIFTIEWNQFLANGAEGLYGSSVFFEPVDMWSQEVGSEYIALGAIEGPDGHKGFHKVGPLAYHINNFIITENNPNPVATVKWLDYFYTEEGNRFFYMGIEDETYVETEDGVEYVEEIENPEGITKDQKLHQVFAWPGKETGMVRQENFGGAETGAVSLAAADLVEEYVPDMWGQLPYTEEEYEYLSAQGADIDNYILEMRDNFIAGEIALTDENWEEYKETLENMGMEDYLQVKTDAYNRYLGN